MRRDKIGVRVGLGILMIALMATSMPQGISEAATARFAKLTAFTGKVTIQKNGGVKTFNAFKGMSLSEGDRIETGVGATAVLEVDKSRTIKMGDKTKIDITELKGSIGNLKSSTKLLNGKILVEIDKKLGTNERFEISTPTAVMGVRGTKFYVIHEKGLTRIGVIEGIVAVKFGLVQPQGIKWLPEMKISKWQEGIREIDADVNGEVYIRTLDIQDLDVFILKEILRFSSLFNAETVAAIKAEIAKKEPLEAERLKSEEQQETQLDSGANDKPIFEGDPDPDRERDNTDPTGNPDQPIGGYNPTTGP